jgi:hypothetical protein
MSEIYSRYWKISSGRHFQNGYHNTAQIYWKMLNLCGIVVGSLKMMTARNFSLSGINLGHHNLPTYEMSLKSYNVEFVRHWKISTDRHFQNGRHNTAKIQHCPISSKFDMWVDYDVPNLLNLYGIVTAILKMATARNVSMPESIGDIIIYPYMKCRWNRTMLNLCGIHMWVDYDVPNLFPTLKNF